MGVNEFVALVPVFSVVLTAALAGFTWWTGRHRQQADVASVLTGSALGLVVALEKRVDELEKDLEAERGARRGLQATIEEQGAVIMQLRDRIQMLEAENVRLKDENHLLRAATSGGR